MGGEIPRSSARTVWALARTQHGVISREQLLALGYGPRAIEHRLATGRLRRLWAGVYAVGRAEVGQLGLWRGAVLACGGEAVLSDRSAAALWGIAVEGTAIEVTVPPSTSRERAGIRVHRRTRIDATHHLGIPVTTVVATIIDLAPALPPVELERLVGDADKLGLTDPAAVRAAAEPRDRRPGARRVRETLDRRTFVLTESRLEQLLLPLARAAGLPTPETQAYVNGRRVDFWWPGLSLVVETDGATYHRTPAQLTDDRRRDNAHTAAGLTLLCFTHAQVRYEPAYVREMLATAAERLQAN